MYARGCTFATLLYPTTTSTNGIIPVRWTAPEGLNEQKYSSASDVWSFGITCIEIFQDAVTPYIDFTSNPAVMAMVNTRQVHPQPAGCTDEVYDELVGCFSFEPAPRPDFPSLQAFFARMAEPDNRITVRDTGSMLSTRGRVKQSSNAAVGVRAVVRASFTNTVLAPKSAHARKSETSSMAMAASLVAQPEPGATGTQIIRPYGEVQFMDSGGPTTATPYEAASFTNAGSGRAPLHRQSLNPSTSERPADVADPLAAHARAAGIPGGATPVRVRAGAETARYRWKSAGKRSTRTRRNIAQDRLGLSDETMARIPRTSEIQIFGRESFSAIFDTPYEEIGAPNPVASSLFTRRTAHSTVEMESKSVLDLVPKRARRLESQNSAV